MKLNKPLKILALIILLGIILRFAFLGSASINGDEGGTVYLAGKSLGSIWELIRGDVQPPLYYFTLHFWTVLGNNAFAVRALSAIFSVLTIPLVFLLGKKLFNENTGLVASLIFAVSQANVRFAQITRGYTMLVFLVSGAIYFFLSMLEENKKGNFFMFFFFSVLSIYAHYYAGFITIALVLFYLYKFSKYNNIVKEWLLTHILIVIAVVPLVPLFLRQITTKTSLEMTWAMDPTFNLSLFSLNANNIFLRIFMIFYHLSIGYLQTNFTNLLYILLFLAILATFIAVLYTSVKTLFKENFEKLVLILLLILVPTIILAFLWLTATITPQTYARYLLFISPIYYVLIAKGILSLENKRKYLGIFLLILILIFNSISLGYHYRENPQKENWNELVSSMDTKDTEVILLYSANYVFDLKYYYKGTSPIYAVPTNLNLHKELTIGEVYSAILPINQDNSCKFKEVTNTGTTGIWLVQADPGLLDTSLLQDCIEQEYKLEETLKNTCAGKTDLIVYHYTR